MKHLSTECTSTSTNKGRHADIQTTESLGSTYTRRQTHRRDMPYLLGERTEKSRKRKRSFSSTHSTYRQNASRMNLDPQTTIPCNLTHSTHLLQQHTPPPHLSITIRVIEKQRSRERERERKNNYNHSTHHDTTTSS